eukprot:UN17452
MFNRIKYLVTTAITMSTCLHSITQITTSYI